VVLDQGGGPVTAHRALFDHPDCTPQGLHVPIHAGNSGAVERCLFRHLAHGGAARCDAGEDREAAGASKNENQREMETHAPYLTGPGARHVQPLVRGVAGRTKRRGAPGRRAVLRAADRHPAQQDGGGRVCARDQVRVHDKRLMVAFH
jgi:hypothetical protein